MGKKYFFPYRWPLLYPIFNFFEIGFQVCVEDKISEKIVIPFFEVRIIKQSTNQLKMKNPKKA